MDASTPRLQVEFLHDHRKLISERALALLEFDTQNPPGQTRAIIDCLETRFTDVGLSAERYAVDPAKPNLIATHQGKTDHVLCFNGHVDTVPFDADEWIVDPLGERDGDRLYGRGATDMKGQIASMLSTARAYVETETTPPVTLQFVLVSDEEIGGDAGLPHSSGGRSTPGRCVCYWRTDLRRWTTLDDSGRPRQYLAHDGSAWRSCARFSTGARRECY